jgi:fused signal recognition particle receptor
MFSWLWSSPKDFLILREQLKKAKTDEEKKSILTLCNFLQEDMVHINMKDIMGSVKKYHNNTFDTFNNFYSQWKNLDDLKKIFQKKINIVYFFGNNGIGKTTSIVNFSNILKQQGFNPLLIAADEFRGGAVQQLISMAQVHDIPVYSSLNYEKEPSLSQIIFDGIQKNCQDHGVILIDTAGRSHADANLLENLKKQYTMAEKVLSQGHDGQIISIWVNDSNIVNAFQQQQSFFEKIPVDYMIMTKTKSHQGYYNFLNIINKVKKPILFTAPNSQKLELFNGEIFSTTLS